MSVLTIARRGFIILSLHKFTSILKSLITATLSILKDKFNQIKAKIFKKIAKVHRCLDDNCCLEIEGCKVNYEVYFMIDFDFRCFTNFEFNNVKFFMEEFVSWKT